MTATWDTGTLQDMSRWSTVFGQFSLVVVTLFVATYLASRPGLALGLGLLCAWVGRNVVIAIPDSVARLTSLSKLCMAWAIVGLGATVEIGAVVHTSTENIGLTIITIVTVLLLGWFGGQKLGLSREISVLIAAGTAICGASAIAAVAAAIRARPVSIAIALGTVVLFNTAALFLFPMLGNALHLTPHQFAIWAGIAIHDTSSVVGAAMSFDPATLIEATTVKLARAIWIAPLTIVLAGLVAKKSPQRWALPWFVWGYWVASCVGWLIPLDLGVVDLVRQVARGMFATALFLLGLSIDLGQLSKSGVGLRPLVLGFVLWIASAGGVLLLVLI